MTTDLLVIHPGAQHGIFGALGDQLTALEPPTWARMLAGYIRDRGYTTKIIDAEAEGLAPEAVAERTEILNPRLVAIVAAGHQPSASTQQMTGAGAIARAIKRPRPDRQIIMTGNHPSALPIRTLSEEAIDYVADGEGVVTVEGLLAGDLPLDEVPGLVWRRALGGQVIANQAAPLTDNLDQDLHGDVWDLLPMDRYRAHNWHAFTGPRRPYASIYTSLGCPFACQFCMINSFQHVNRYRTFSPPRIVGHIEKLYYDYGVRSLKIADEMFVLKESHYLAIAQGIIDAGLDDLNIWAYARVDTVRPNTLSLLRAAGFRWLALGIESGSAHVRDGAGKRLRTGDIVDVVRAVQAADINVIGNFMFGLRDDTEATMRQTLELAQACLPEFANFYCTMAYPGSPLYDQALREGWTLSSSWRAYSQHNDDCRPLDTEHVDAATVLRFRDAAFRAYFNAPAYRDLVARKFGSAASADIDKMLSYRLTRKLLA